MGTKVKCTHTIECGTYTANPWKTCNFLLELPNFQPTGVVSHLLCLPQGSTEEAMASREVMEREL